MKIPYEKDLKLFCKTLQDKFSRKHDSFHGRVESFAGLLLSAE